MARICLLDLAADEVHGAEVGCEYDDLFGRIFLPQRAEAAKEVLDFGLPSFGKDAQQVADA